MKLFYTVFYKEYTMSDYEEENLNLDYLEEQEEFVDDAVEL